MNEKTKLLRNFLFLSLFSYLLFLISCNEDLEEIDGTHFGRKHSDNVKILTGNEAKLIFNKLVNESKNNQNFDILGNKLKINGKNSFLLKSSDQTTIDYSQIMQVSDLQGNVNYTFKVLNHPDDDENTFHNLVYNNQNTSSPRINLLKFDNVGANFRTTDNSTMTSASLVAASDPCPPVTNPINNPVVGNPGGGNPGGGNPIGGNPIGGNPGGGNPGGGSNGDNPNYISAPTSISFQCNSCSFNSSTWEGMLTHGYNGPNNTFTVYPFTFIIHKASSSQNTTLPSNPCDTQGDIGVLPNTSTPCEELKTNSLDADFKAKMQSLFSNIGGTHEKSFGIANGKLETPIKNNPTCEEIQTGTDQEAAVIPYKKSLKAIAHNHLNNPIYNHIGTFSPNDIVYFSNLIITAEQQASLVTKDEFAFYLVCQEGNYAIKVSDIDKLYNFSIKYATDDNFFLEINKYCIDKNILHGKEKNLQNMGFLKLLKDYDLGIDYFEGDSNFQNWKKLELNQEQTNITEKPC